MILNMASSLDNLQADDSDITSVKRITESRTKAPELPYGKEFHLLVCYTEENAAEVRTIVENLEREGLKCSYHERDFTAGQNIFQNINNGIENSMGILVVLSEEFGKGQHGFCHHEIQQALHARITKGYIVIPLKIEPCSPPETLQQLSYIDAQKTDVDEMHVLVMNAFLLNVWQAEQNETNGQTVTYPLVRYKTGWKWLSLSRYKLEIDAGARHSIWEKGFQIPDERIDEIQKLVSDSIHVRYRHVFKRQLLLICLVFFMLSLLNVAINYIYIGLSSGREMNETHSSNASYGFIASIFSIVGLWLVLIAVEILGRSCNYKQWKGLTYVLQEKSKQRLKRALWRQINSKIARQDKTIVIFENDMLLILRFNLKPCQDVFVRRCGYKEALTNLIEPGETHLEYAERLVDWYLQVNSHMLAVPNKTYSRHEMVNGASCLCLLLESSISGD